MMSLFMYMIFMISLFFISIDWFYLKLYFQNMCFLKVFLLLFKFSMLNMCWTKIYGLFGLEIYSFMLVMLSFWIMGLMVSTLNLNQSNLFMYCLMIKYVILVFLILCFISMDLMMFYFCFESSLIPTFLLIVIWGVGIDRISAGFYLLFYTMFFSFPLFLIILIIMDNYNSSSYLMLEMFDYPLDSFMVVLFLLSFLVKVPSFMIHIWLTKAHVEAPVYGSMLLAGVMLKLGGYGLMRFMVIFSSSVIEECEFYIYWMILGSLFISLICLNQIDLKMLVAYSSVVHMGIMSAGLMTMSISGYIGAYMVMISHGLCSSGLFYLVNLCYERTGSRLMILNKGMMSVMPMMTLWWFLLCSSNASAPISLNLMGEILLLMSLISYNSMLMMLLMMLGFFSFIYSIYLFSITQHGSNNYFLKIDSGKMIEFVMLLFHWVPVNFFIFNLVFFMS